MTDWIAEAAGGGKSDVDWAALAAQWARQASGESTPTLQPPPPFQPPPSKKGRQNELFPAASNISSSASPSASDVTHNVDEPHQNVALAPAPPQHGDYGGFPYPPPHAAPHYLGPPPHLGHPPPSNGAFPRGPPPRMDFPYANGPYFRPGFYGGQPPPSHGPGRPPYPDYRRPPPYMAPPTKPRDATSTHPRAPREMDDDEYKGSFAGPPPTGDDPYYFSHGGNEMRDRSDRKDARDTSVSKESHRAKRSHSPLSPTPAFDATAQKKTMPLWIRQELERIETEKLKKKEREGSENDKAERYDPILTEDSSPLQKKQTQESSISSPGDIAANGSTESPDRDVSELRTPSPIMTEEEREEAMLKKTKILLTETLLAVTNEEIYQVAREVYVRARKKLPPKLLKASIGLASYDSGSESETQSQTSVGEESEDETELMLRAEKKRKAYERSRRETSAASSEASTSHQDHLLPDSSATPAKRSKMDVDAAAAAADKSPLVVMRNSPVNSSKKKRKEESSSSRERSSSRNASPKSRRRSRSCSRSDGSRERKRTPKKSKRHIRDSERDSKSTKKSSRKSRKSHRSRSHSPDKRSKDEKKKKSKKSRHRSRSRSVSRASDVEEGRRRSRERRRSRSERRTSSKTRRRRSSTRLSRSCSHPKSRSKSSTPGEIGGGRGSSSKKKRRK